MSEPQRPQVVLDYHGVLAAHPEITKSLGIAHVIPYHPGASNPRYYMCDSIALYADRGDNLDQLYMTARQSAPLAHQAIFFGEGAPNIDSRSKNACVVCADRDIWQRQKYIC